MSKGLQKSLQNYISKLKNNTQPLQNTPNPLKSTSRLLSACKNPKTPSFAVDQNQSNGQDNALTLTDIDRFLIENFNSLYTDDQNRDDDNHMEENGYDKSSLILSESPKFFKVPPNLHSSQRFFVSPGTSNSLVDSSVLTTSDGDDEPPTRPHHTDENGCDQSVILSESPKFFKVPPNLHSSQRFFVSPAGTSNSLVDEARSIDEASSSDGDDELPTLPHHTVAVLTSSQDPYDDFRRSMQEMVEVRQGAHRQPLDWDFLEELLFCYLKLNEKKVHKYILGAYMDLMVSFRRDMDRIPVSQPYSGKST
ncbi:transcription repressor OFP14-like [Tasmannia lanceolata]|uniref:transcription repressor OFP14-like n=1 Tax=Tasmannia lanceolata TaxID=3420 RepID=UPI0040637506